MHKLQNQKRAQGPTTIAQQSRRFIFFMLTPATVLLLGLTLVPFLATFIMSFSNYSLLFPTGARWVGLENYSELLSSRDFWQALRVTGTFTLFAVGIETILGLGIATLLYYETRGSSLLRAVYLLPMVVTPVAATFTFRFMFNPNLGVFNHFLSSLGLQRQAWLADPSLALWALIIVDVWQWTPFIMLILYGGLSSLPLEPFEAAKVDGASALQLFLFVTLPLLKPFIAIALLIRTLDAFKTFDIIYVLTGGGPGTTTRTLNLLAFKEGIEYLSMGYAAAISIVMLILAIVFARVFLRHSELLR